MENKTKRELIEIIKELEEKNSNLENDVDYWQEEYNDIEEQLENAFNQIKDMDISNGIKDINNFIWKLKLDKLYTKELDNFINNYLKCYNE